MQKVLVTGGAGFIGSHVVAALLARDCVVMSFDCLVPQVHPNRPDWPDYQPDHPNLEKWCGDVRDPHRAVAPALREFQPDTVIHLAALVGVGQSNYEPAQYTSANLTGTMNLLDSIYKYNLEAEEADQARQRLEVAPERLWELLVEQQGTPLQEDGTPWEREAFLREARKEAATQAETFPKHKKVQQVFIAGSMSSYGEGATEFIEGAEQSVPTRETDGFFPASVYAWTKAQQEIGALLFGKLIGLDVRVGRFFNVYGRNQSLTNPYTGVGAIFSARALHGLAPVVYEDGMQSRDFIHVSDVVSGIIAILEKGEPYRSYNIGTGQRTTVLDLACRICMELHTQEPDTQQLSPIVTGQIRVGDIRHCVADVSRLRALGWAPTVSLEDGVRELIAWVREQPAAATQELLDRAHQDLLRHGLLQEG